MTRVYSVGKSHVFNFLRTVCCKWGNGGQLPPSPHPSPGARSSRTRLCTSRYPHPAPRNSSKNLSSSHGGREPGQPTAGTSKGIYKYSCRRKNRHFSSSSQPCLSPTLNLSWLGAYPSSCWAKVPNLRYLTGKQWRKATGRASVHPKELNFCPCLPCQVVSQGIAGPVSWRCRCDFKPRGEDYGFVKNFRSQNSGIFLLLGNT